MFDKLDLIDDIRRLALELMHNSTELDYAEASKQAKVKILGSDVKFIYADTKKEVGEAHQVLSYLEIAKKELPPSIKPEVYSDAQLKEMIIAHRMGVDIESFVNIFFNPEQLNFITLVASAGMDITPYITNLKFDPVIEMQKLEGDNGASEADKVYTLEKAA